LSSDPIAMCELLVGLPEVTVLDVTEGSDRLTVTIETRSERPSCPRCEAPVQVKDRDLVELTDLPCFGTPAVLAWRKTRYRCVAGCGSFTEHAPRSRRPACESPIVRLGGPPCRWDSMAGRWPRWRRTWGAGGTR
jgi:transposase